MLENLKGAHEVELAPTYLLQPSVCQASGVQPVPFQASPCGRYGLVVEVDPHVIESIGEKNANRPLSDADFKRSSRVDPNKELANRVVPQPRMK